MLAIHGCGGHQFALEAHRRSVTEGRMSAASIVPTFDPFKDRQLRLDLRAKVAPIEQLTFQRGEKRLGHGVVVRISDRTNGWHDAHFAAALAEGEAGVLGGFNRSLQHFKSGGCNDEAKTIGSGGTGQAVLARKAIGGATRGA
jgi:hypothetical protein